MSRKEREERERQRDLREERAISAERGDPPSDYDSEEEEDLAGSDMSSLRTFQRSDFQVPISPSTPLQRTVSRKRYGQSFVSRCRNHCNRQDALYLGTPHPNARSHSCCVAPRTASHRRICFLPSGRWDDWAGVIRNGAQGQATGNQQVRLLPPFLPPFLLSLSLPPFLPPAALSSTSILSSLHPFPHSLSAPWCRPHSQSPKQTLSSLHTESLLPTYCDALICFQCPAEMLLSRLSGPKAS